MYRAFRSLVGVVAVCALFLVGCENKNQNEAAVSAASTTPTQETVVKNPLVEINTSLGKIVVELDAQKAPITVENFVTYVNDGFYSQTIFHRVIPGFMVQGGGFTTDFQQKETRAPIKNEANNGLQNKRGTLAMARTMDPNSASAQFFINLTDNDFLNYRSPQEQGYAVFGKVVDGMAVVDQIAKQPTTNRNGHADVPVNNIVIESMKVVEAQQPAEAKTTP